ncbi:transposase IS4 family protein, partial [mine drainage metagenome]
LRTDVRDRPALEIVKTYKNLWVLEHTFREIKGPLDLRPMWHRKPDRVKAHIWICVLAYLVAKVIEDEVNGDKSLVGDDKGTFTSSRILGRFDTVALVEQGFKDEKGKLDKRWWTTTELDSGQLQMLKALKIGREAFKPGRVTL